MKLLAPLILGFSVFAGSAVAQAPPPKAGTTAETTTPGSNSFTEGQAKSRLEKAGYSKITDLKKDDQGIWRAKAEKDGKSVNVALDYQGKIAAK